MKRRPRISLVGPRAVAAGGRFEATLVLDCPAPIEVRSVEVEMIARSIWLTQSQYGESRHQQAHVVATAQLHGPGQLERGLQPLPFSFTLPARLPGSFRGRHVRFECTLAARIDIPRWPDARAVFEIHVLAAAAPDGGQPRPFVVMSRPDGARGTGPYFELSMTTRDLPAGGRVDGAVSFANTAHNRYRGLELSLIAVQSAAGGLLGFKAIPEEIASWRVDLGDQVPADNQAFPFAISIPARVTPTFTTDAISLWWELEATARIAWAPDLSVTVPISIQSAAADARPVRVPPAVGSERVESVWKDVAAAAGFVYVGGALERRVDDVEVRIWREHHDRRGPILVFELTFQDLGIGLGLIGSRRTSTLRARDDAQSRALRKRLDSALAACAPVTAVNDHLIRCEWPGAGARVEPLKALAAAVSGLATALVAARQALGPPAAVAGHLPRWRKLAELLAAQLQPWRPAVVGTRDSIAFEVALDWHDARSRPDCVRIAARSLLPIPEAQHLSWRDGDPWPRHGSPAERAATGALAVDVDRAAVRVVARYEPEPARALARRVDDAVRAARELSTAGPAGPYR